MTKVFCPQWYHKSFITGPTILLTILSNVLLDIIGILMALQNDLKGVKRMPERSKDEAINTFPSGLLPTIGWEYQLLLFPHSHTVQLRQFGHTLDRTLQ
jgi:hypothetical protein